MTIFTMSWFIKINYKEKEKMDLTELYVNLTECSFSIKGTEEFIDRKTEELLEMFKKIGENKVQIKQLGSSCAQTIENDEENANGMENSYQKYEDAGLISVDKDEVLILRPVPGNNNATKMKNVALITMYALDKQIEAKSITSNCEKLNCFDSKNFSAVFKNDKSWNFIRRGKGQNWTLSLTIPGKDKAIEVLEEMYNNAIKK